MNKKKFACIVVIGSLSGWILYMWIVTFSNIIHQLERCFESSWTLPRYRGSEYDPRWTWICQNNICVMQPYVSGKQISLQKCNMLCSKPQLWPIPKQIKQEKKKYHAFNLNEMDVKIYAKGPVKRMMMDAFDIFRKNIAVLMQPSNIKTANEDKFLIEIILNNSLVTKLTLDTPEQYTLAVDRNSPNIIAAIVAPNFFGARHGLETLSQLIWFDNVDKSLNILYGITIYDKPSFPYRGLMVDTARNYFPLNLLKKVIRGMAANKLNVFHWHLTDSQSFPFVAPSYPDLAKYGSFSPSMVYTANDVHELVEFANLFGVRVLIEIDAPSHLYSGWKDINTSTDIIIANSDNTTGQLNPENPEGLAILKNIYSNILQLMDNNDLFHIGGDEINTGLWSNLLDENYEMNSYWGSYMQTIISTLRSVDRGKRIKKIIMWSSELTDSETFLNHVDLKTTIIQYWYGSLQPIVDYGVGVIFSMVGAWYLDCGFGAWQEGRQPNCDPYKTWQTMYRAAPWNALELTKNVYGGEVCMWTEQVGEDSLETRLWPRSAAFAERIWSDPQISDKIPKQVYTRLDTQRERMSSRDIKSEVLWSKFCTLNPGKC